MRPDWKSRECRTLLKLSPKSPTSFSHAGHWTLYKNWSPDRNAEYLEIKATPRDFNHKQKSFESTKIGSFGRVRDFGNSSN